MMAEQILDGTMARDDRAAKIERRIVEEATRVAQHRRVTLAEYLSSLLRDTVHRDYLAALKAEYDAALGGEAKPAKRKPKGGA